jgi:single-strand DNA-binding protein
MTKDLNRVQLLGHLGADPDLRTVDTGQTLATFSIATSRWWKDASGQAQEATDWSRIVAWGRLAELVGQSLQQGARVYLEGRLKTRTWVDTETAERHWQTEVVLDELILLDGPRTDDASPADTPQGPAAPGPGTEPDATAGTPRRRKTPPGVQPPATAERAHSGTGGRR